MPEAHPRHVSCTECCASDGRNEPIVAGKRSEYLKRELIVGVQGRPFQCRACEIDPHPVLAKDPIGRGDWILFCSV